MTTGIRYTYRLVDQNNKRVSLTFANDKWELITTDLVKGEWQETRDRLSEDDIGAMNFQIMRLFTGPPQPQQQPPLVKQ
jgi:hypothetical protein